MPSSFAAPKRFFDRANQPKSRVRIAFEVEDRIDDVFEHAWAGDGALLRHVADEDHHDAALLGQAR